MKRLIVCLILLSGCASFEMDTPSGYHVKYSRFWDQELNGVSFETGTNGTVKGGIESQTSHQDKTIQLLLQTLLQGGK